ncbi:hypothetical protein HDE_03840 [Halotydeus destructor]|nr:hypothetical protein HDE_03840 [Halotydeus destructor]
MILPSHLFLVLAAIAAILVGPVWAEEGDDDFVGVFSGGTLIVVGIAIAILIPLLGAILTVLVPGLGTGLLSAGITGGLSLLTSGGQEFVKSAIPLIPILLQRVPSIIQGFLD